MADHIKQTLGDVQAAVDDLERQLAEKKKLANWLSEMAGDDPVYEITEPDNAPKGRPKRGDEFVGLTAIQACRKAMEMCDSPLETNEVYETLLSGGYTFETRKESNAKNSLRVTLSKNSSVFHKLSNGKYGLVKWYPNLKPKKKTVIAEAEEDSKGREVMDEEFGSNGQQNENLEVRQE